jgi:hypothetical protein
MVEIDVECWKLWNDGIMERIVERSKQAQIFFVPSIALPSRRSISACLENGTNKSTFNNLDFENRPNILKP